MRDIWYWFVVQWCSSFVNFRLNARIWTTIVRLNARISTTIVFSLWPYGLKCVPMQIMKWFAWRREEWKKKFSLCWFASKNFNHRVLYCPHPKFQAKGVKPKKSALWKVWYQPCRAINSTYRVPAISTSLCLNILLNICYHFCVIHNSISFQNVIMFTIEMWTSLQKKLFLIKSCKIVDIRNDNLLRGYQEGVRTSRIKIFPEDIKCITSLKSIMCSSLELQSRLPNISHEWFVNIWKLHLCYLCLNAFLCKMKSSKNLKSYEYSNTPGTTMLKWKMLQEQIFVQMQRLFCAFLKSYWFL